MPTGQKHLVKCKCVLQQYRHLSEPPLHQFVVFSEVDDDDNVKRKLAQCNNCDAVHNVYEIGKSEVLMGREHASSIVTVSDIKQSLPDNVASVLESNSADVATWEAAKFIIVSKQWGNFVTLTSDTDGDTKHGKYLRILGETLLRVETYSRETVAK